MLTLPSESQTVLMEPLPSIPPSFVTYGLSGSRRSPRKHQVTERREPTKPYPNRLTRPRINNNSSSSTKVPHSVPSRAEKTPLKQPPVQERRDFNISTGNICEQLTRPQISSHKPCPPPPLSDSSKLDGSSHVGPKPGPDSTGSSSLLVPDPAQQRGWVIGPLFQSFKSKMASFTEIVMSPFKSANDPSENSTIAEDYVTAEEEPTDQRADEEKSPPKRVKIAEEDDLNCENRDNSDPKLQNDVVPLQTQTEQEASIIAKSAWNSTTTTTEFTEFTSTAATFCDVNDFAEEEDSAMGGARARKRPSKVAPKSTEVDDSSVKGSQWNVLNNADSRDENGASNLDRTAISDSALDEASLRKVKRTLDLGEDSAKRKKIETQQRDGEVARAEKPKPKLNKSLLNVDETPITKANTRSKNNRSKADTMTVNNERNASDLVDLSTVEDAKGAKAKPAKRTKSKGDQSLLLQTSVAVGALEKTLDSKQAEKPVATGKKRKAKDESNAKSDTNETAVPDPSLKAGQKLKKTKTAAREKSDVEGKAEKVYFEMTPSEGDAADVSRSNEVAEERGVAKRRVRRMDPQRRRCRAIHSPRSPTKRSAESCLGPMTRGDSEAFRRGSSTRLLRSVSCPEIPTLPLLETPWTPHFHSPPRSRSQPPQQQQPNAAAPPHGSSASSSLAHHFHRSARRTRRHTVCSVEVEREIAPLCLRKEVYPARRSPSPYDPQHISPMRALSPGASLSALASCFLSSPLAFLSKKSESGRSAVSSPTVSRSLSPTVRALSPSVRSLSPSVRSLSPTVRLLSPSPAVLRALSADPPPRSSSPPSSLSSLLGTSLGQLPGFHLRTDTLLGASADPSNSVALLCSDQTLRPEEDEDTASSSPESEELREESAHSDSELKVLKKDHGQRKVSSIKIRKALPKPQNNLTPMGLPKAVRVKKKEFSLEEIYTNKNFSKPPESRLETIFEIPLSRKNGSESWCGPRRLKRFLEFPELGEPRRPRKPPQGAAAKNAALAKANANASSRPRRGGCREDPNLDPDPDSVLCAKLEQLGNWLRQNEDS